MMRDVASLSEGNLSVPLLSSLWTIDEGRYYKEFLYLHKHMDVVESMLCSPAHMQVSVVYLWSRYKKYTTMTGFQKNIICFPQDVLELQQLQNFFSNLQVDDIVNVRLPHRTSNLTEYAKARVEKKKRNGENFL